MDGIGKSIFLQHHIKVNQDTQKELTDAIHVYLYRITTIVVFIALSHGTRKITTAHVDGIATLFRGYSQAGGTVMASDYYGYNHSAYSTHIGFGNSSTRTVDFDMGLARAPPDLSFSGGAGAKIDTRQDIRKAVRELVKKHKSTITTDALDKLVGIVQGHLTAFVSALHNNKKKEVTIRDLRRVLKDKRFSMFS